MVTISQELVAALDDLIQVGAQASASIREAIEQLTGPRTWERNTLDVAMGTLNSVKTAARTEQSMPTIIVSARDALVQLRDLAGRVGDSNLAAALNVKVEAFRAHMKASGLGTPWLTVIGLGAGAVALYFLWKNYSKKKSVASFEYPEPDEVRPRLAGLKQSLGSFRKFGAASCRPQLGRSGKRRGRLGAAEEKYEFEPEIRLEGHRGGRRTRSRK